MMPSIYLLTCDPRLAEVVRSLSTEQGWELQVGVQVPRAGEPEAWYDLVVIDVRPVPNSTLLFRSILAIMIERTSPLRARRLLVLGHHEEMVGRANTLVHGGSAFHRIHQFGVPPSNRLERDLLAAINDALALPEYRPANFHDAFPNREFYRSAFESMQWPVLILSPDGLIKVMNLRALAQFDYSTQMVINQDWAMLIAPEDRAKRAEELLLRFTGGFYNEARLRLVDRRGREFPAYIISSRVYPHQDTSEAPYIILVVQDLTALESLQHQLTTFQRLQSVERVVAGMTHEFNNLLTAVYGHAELLVQDLPVGSQMRSSAEVIRRECERARDLTSRLLGLSSSRQFLPGPVSCNEVVANTLKLLQHSLGEGVCMHAELIESGDMVEGDAGQLQQVLVNLCLNARDAIEGKGTITIRTSVCAIAPEECRLYQDRTPGVYVEIAVMDTGCGMSEEVLDHVFEPFFTTKPPGSGSGLGMTVVRGIVRSHNGHVALESAPGRGTTVRVRLPQTHAAVNPEGSEGEVLSPSADGHGQWIMVVDDEPSVVVYAQKVLERAGYRVRPVKDAVIFMPLFEQHRNEVALIILDLIMPGVSGRELLTWIRRIDPQVPVILSSGFVRGGIDNEMAGMVQGFLRKPYRPEDLLEQVRELLADTPAQ